VREAIAFLLLACACGAVWSGKPDPRKRPASEEGPDAPGSDLVPGAADGGREAGFASLEALAPSLAPGMRRAVERESRGERVELVQAAGRDTCVRVAFEATGPIQVRLLDADGMVLSETRSPTTSGALAERGPVCVRKTGSVAAVTEGTVARIRWVAWASP
jgi:hypothetical protein